MRLGRLDLQAGLADFPHGRVAVGVPGSVREYTQHYRKNTIIGKSLLMVFTDL